MIVVVVREHTFDLDGKPDIEITGVFHGFANEDDAVQWINNIQAEWKSNPSCVWSIIDSDHKSIMI